MSYSSNTRRTPRIRIYEESEPEVLTQYVKLEKPVYVTRYVTKPVKKETYVTVYVSTVAKQVPATEATKTEKTTKGVEEITKEESTAVGTTEDLKKRHEQERGGIEDVVKKGEWYNKQYKRYKAMEERYDYEFQAKQIREALSKKGLLTSIWDVVVTKRCYSNYCEVGNPDEKVFYDVLRKMGIEKADKAMALWTALANYKLDWWKPPITGDTYNQVMVALKSAKKVLEDENASPQSIYNAILIIESLLRKAEETKLSLLAKESTPTLPGTYVTVPTPDQLKEILEGIDKKTEEYLEKIKKGEDIGPSWSTDLVWKIEKGLEYLAGWPSIVAESVAQYFEDKAKKEENPLMRGIYGAIASEIRFGGGVATGAWNVFLAAITGGLSAPVQITALTDSLWNSVNDPVQREAMAKAFSDPKFVTTVVLPMLAGAAVGGYVGTKLSPKLIKASLDFTLKHYNDSGWRGQLARTLLKYGKKVGTIKMVKTFTDPQKLDFWVVQDKDGNVWVYTRESGVVRVDSKLKPTVLNMSQKLEAMSKALDDSTYQELVKAVRVASLRGDAKLLSTLDDLLDDIADIKDAQLVRNVVNFIKNNLDDPSQLTSVEYFIRLTKSGKVPKEVLTKIVATLDDQRYGGVFRELWEGVGKERALKIIQDISKYVDELDPDKLTKIFRVYKISGISPDDVTPDEVLHLVISKGDDLTKVLDDIEDLLARARGAGKTEIAKVLQRFFKDDVRLKEMLETLDDDTRPLVQRIYLSAVRKALLRAGYSADEVDEVLSRVVPSDMIPPGYGIAAKISTKGGTFIVNVGKEGIADVRQVGYSVIDESLLKNPTKTVDDAARFDLAEVEYGWIDDQSRIALLERLKNLGVEPDQYGYVRITKDVARKLLKSGVEGKLREMLERLVNSYSDKAFIQLTSKGKDVILYIPRSDAPVAGYYNLATLIRYRLGEILNKVTERLGISKDRLRVILKERGYDSIDDLVRKELPNDLARVKVEAMKLTKEQNLDPETALRLALNKYVMEASASGDQLTMLKANLLSSMIEKSLSLGSDARALLSSPLIVSVTPDEGLLLGVAIPSSIASGLTAVESEVTQQELRKAFNALLQEGVTAITQEQLQRYIPGVSVNELAQVLGLREVVVPVEEELVVPIDMTETVTLMNTVEQYTTLEQSIPMHEVVVPVEEELVERITIDKDIDKYISIERPTALALSERLREVVIPIEEELIVPIEVPRLVTTELTLERDNVLTVNTLPKEEAVPVVIEVPVELYDVVMVPIEVEEIPPPPNTNKPPTTTPTPAPGFMPLPGGGGFGSLPSSPRPRRSRKRQEEVVEL